MKRSWIFCLLFTVNSFHISAQPVIDLVDLRFQSFNDSPFNRQYSAKLLLPLELKNDNTLLMGLAYDKSMFRNAQDGKKSVALTSTALFTGASKNLDHRWNVLGLVHLKVNAGFRDLDIEDLQLGGILVATREMNKNLSFKFGLYYNREYFGNFFMPLVGLDWKVNQRLNLYGVLPGNMNLEYRLSQNWYTGLTYQSITASYLTADKSQYVRDGHKFWGHNQLKLFINYYPLKKLMLYGELGHTSFREFKLYNRNNNLIAKNPLFDSIEDQWLFSVGMALRIRLKDENQ